MCICPRTYGPSKDHPMDTLCKEMQKLNEGREGRRLLEPWKWCEGAHGGAGAGRAACVSKCLCRQGCYLKRTFLTWMGLDTRFTALGLPQDSKYYILSNEEVGQVPCTQSYSVAKVWVRIMDMTHWSFIFGSAHLQCTLSDLSPLHIPSATGNQL